MFTTFRFIFEFLSLQVQCVNEPKILKECASMPAIDPPQFLLDLYASAVDAVSAKKCLPAFLPQPSPLGRTLVIGAGKGAAAMAQVVEQHWQGDNVGFGRDALRSRRRLQADRSGRGVASGTG